MKLITRNTDYALRAICYIAKQKELVSADELVRMLGVPRQFMRKILRQLNNGMILKSYKGQGGGFKLKASPDKIYLMTIMRIFQGEVSFNGCFLKKNICPNKSKCALRKKIRLIEENALEQLRMINIASLI
jgi:Rrf2 family protein